MTQDESHELPDDEERPYGSREPGEPPGTLEDIPHAPTSELVAYGFGADDYEFAELDAVDEVVQLHERWPLLWLNVTGVGDASRLKKIGDYFDFHDLQLEDVQNFPQRPKAEVYRERLYVIAMMATMPDSELILEHVSVYVGQDFVVTFQQTPGDSLDPVRQRIRNSSSRLRQSGADYLAYAVIDAIVDGYFPLLDRFASELSHLEADIVESRDKEVIADIHRAKSHLFDLQRAARPQRDMINSIIRNPGGMISDETLRYFGDCQDHAIQITEAAESYRQMADGLLDLHMSVSSHRMNEVMKVLTIIATIFIPLTFIAGIYGMNFDPEASPLNMPELGWAYGYPVVLIMMSIIAALLVWFFQAKGWIGQS